MNRGQQMTLLGGIGLIAGALLPWASMTSLALGASLSAAGYEGDGAISGIIGLALAITAFMRKGSPGRRYSVPLGLLTLVAGWIGLSAWARLWTAVSAVESGLAASIGPGVYLTMAAALLGLIGCLQKVPAVAKPPAAASASAAMAAPQGQMEQQVETAGSAEAAPVE